MSSCLFCRIIAKELPGYVVYETETVIAFLDIFPVHPGHVLVVPKTHAELLTDLSESECGEVFTVLPKIGRALQQATGCEGFTLLQNNGTASGQVVPHVHIHLIPRWSTDGLRHWPGQPLASEEGERVLQRFREAIQS
jgi:histidine triad (HIT) family protein